MPEPSFSPSRITVSDQRNIPPAPELIIAWVRTRDEALARLSEGFCPVECAFGEPVVDELRMDHHGQLSRLEGVALRAYRDHFSARYRDPRFVVTGSADADCTFAIAALAGLFPPREHVDLLPLAELIDRVDRDPIGLDILSRPHGPELLLWNALSGGPHGTLSFMAGVHLWRRLVSGSVHPDLLAAAANAERLESSGAEQEVTHELGPVLFVSGARRKRFENWYGRNPQAPAHSPTGWRHPVVVAHVAAAGRVTVGCPNLAVAESLFGPGGLLVLFRRLGPDWGGREAIGGSPRGVSLSERDAMEVAASAYALLGGFDPDSVDRDMSRL